MSHKLSQARRTWLMAVEALAGGAVAQLLPYRPSSITGAAAGFTNIGEVSFPPGIDPVSWIQRPPVGLANSDIRGIDGVPLLGRRRSCVSATP